jgi:Icc-related predicted phosphoesterase
MRFLAFTDLHGAGADLEPLAARAAAPGIDALLCAGDFTRFGAGAADVLRRLERAGRPLYLAPGNHEDDGLLDLLRVDYPFLHDVNGRWVDAGGVWVCGFGGPAPFRKNLPNDREDPHPELEALWRDRPGDAAPGARPVVFVTHYPPVRTLDGGPPGLPSGSALVRAFIERAKPALVVCGHEHAAFGREARIGPSRIVNPGPGGMTVEV